MLKESFEDRGKFLEAIQGVCLDPWLEVIELKDKLNGVTHQADELMKESANLKFEVAGLHEHMNKIKKETIKEFRVSQPYFDEIGGYYEDGFDDFCNQATLIFLDLEFSQIQIRLNAPTTLATDPILDDEEIDDKVLVINGPASVADDPKELEQPTNPLVDP